jgi:hypothetical protein
MYEKFKEYLDNVYNKIQQVEYVRWLYLRDLHPYHYNAIYSNDCWRGDIVALFMRSVGIYSNYKNKDISKIYSRYVMSERVNELLTNHLEKVKQLVEKD